MSPRFGPLGLLYTYEEHRSLGLGKLVVAKACKELLKLGVKTPMAVVEESNTPSKRLFYGLGFEDTQKMTFLLVSPKDLKKHPRMPANLDINTDEEED